MEEVTVKEEFNCCRLCLSTNRAVVKIGDEYLLLYQLLTSNFEKYTSDMKWLICWECRAKLRKIKEFQLQVDTANQILHCGMPLNQSLSTLTMGCAYQFTLEPKTADISQNISDDSLCNVPTTDTNLIPSSEYQVVSKISNITIEMTNYETLINEANETVALKHEDNEWSDQNDGWSDKNDDFTENTNEPNGTDSKITPIDEETEDEAKIKIKKEKLETNLKKIVRILNKNKEGKKRKTRKRNDKSNRPKFKKLTVEKYDGQLYFDKLYRDDFHSHTNKEKGFKYKCEDCDLYFETLWGQSFHLGHHLQRKTIYACNICSRTQPTKKELRAHILGRHKHYYRCRLCGQTIHTSPDCYLHYHKVHVRRYECLLCQLKFSSRTEFHNHWDELHSRFVCNDCGLVRSTKKNLITHIRYKHRTIKEKPENKYSCKDCCRKFIQQKTYREHMKRFHDPESVPAYCVECDMHFPTLYRYKRHLSNTRRHGGGKLKKLVQCPECKQFFKGNAYMQDHYDYVHLKNYKYRCEECNLNFARKYKLDDHNKRQHLGIMPPKNKICTICGRGFTSNKILENHMRTHTGERPYQCSCGAAFAQSYALTTHARKQGHTALPYVKKKKQTDE